MVEISIRNSSLIVEVLGIHKLWALKKQIEVPLSAIRSIETRATTKLGWWHGARLPGTHVPGVIVAGSYRKNGVWEFWDVVKTQNTVVIDLENHRYHRLVVEVAEPQETVDRVLAAIA